MLLLIQICQTFHIKLFFPLLNLEASVGDDKWLLLYGYQGDPFQVKQLTINGIFHRAYCNHISTGLMSSLKAHQKRLTIKRPWMMLKRAREIAFQCAFFRFYSEMENFWKINCLAISQTCHSESTPFCGLLRNLLPISSWIFPAIDENLHRFLYRAKRNAFVCTL